MGDHEFGKLDIERYSVGELPRLRAAALEAHLHGCAVCSGFYARIKQEQGLFLAAHPFSEVNPDDSIAERTARRTNGRELWYERLFDGFAVPALRPVLIPACLLVMTAMIAVPFMGHFMNNAPKPGADYRYKGSALPLQLPYIYKRNGAIYESAPDDVFQAGDRVQLFYASLSDRFLTLLSVDGCGAVSFYQPVAHSTVCSIRSGVGTRLAYPLSIDLDDAPEAELVIALFSDAAFTTDQVRLWVAGIYTKGNTMAELEKKVRGKPPVGCTVKTLYLKKK